MGIMILVYSFRYGESLFVLLCCSLMVVGKRVWAVLRTKQSPHGKRGIWGWDWWVNCGMWKKLCPDWLNSVQGSFRKVISFNHSDQKAIIFGTPTLPFIKAQTLLSHRSLPWLLAFMSILTSPFLPKMAVLAEEVKKTVCPRPAAN